MKKKIKKAFLTTKKIVSIRRCYLEYLRAKQKSKVFNEKVKEKVLIIDVESSHIYHRYFYTMVKFFSIEGYTIYFPRFSFYFFFKDIFISSRSVDGYYDLIFEEGLMVLGEKPKNSDTNVHFKIDGDNLSHDYFSDLLNIRKSPKNSYHIPMAMHPLFYSKKLWNVSIDYNQNRKTSIFMVGNLDINAYAKERMTLFNTCGRIEIIEYLKSRDKVTSIGSALELENFIASDNDQTCLIIDRKDFSIGMPDLRKKLGQFYFYLTLPGVCMPFSHNLIEALSVGAIPIIQKSYAKLMIPKLVHMKNAIIFDDLEDLIPKMEFSYRLTDNQKLELVKNVLNYYNSYLTPSSVVNTMIQNKPTPIYLQAEHNSVELVREHI